jgi:hypothetical protein
MRAERTKNPKRLVSQAANSRQDTREGRCNGNGSAAKFTDRKNQSNRNSEHSSSRESTSALRSANGRLK